MKKSKFFGKAGLSMALAVVMMIAANATYAAPVSGQFKRADNQPTISGELDGATDGVYIVRLADPSIATYAGGIAGFQATSARVNGHKRLDTNSEAAQMYGKHLKARQRAVLGKAERKLRRELRTRYDYQHAINGFAVELTVEEAKAMANMSEVVSVKRERMERLLTDVGPKWIGAKSIWNDGGNGSKGEGMVVAILDTGINSDHPSFAAQGDDGYYHSNPLGSGNYLPGSYCDAVDSSFCNDKLIGAWDFVDTDGTVPEDNDGHGSHTAGTTAGNVVRGAVLDAPTISATFNRISGVAPHANIIAYDVCDDGCPGSSLLAAVNQAIIDAGNLPRGIAALNYSISGGGNPYNDPIELGFLSAVEAGIYVAASAGNAGPGPSTVAHLGPWVSTTAASTHNRAIQNALINLASDADPLADISGRSFSAGYGPAPIIHANTTAFDPTGQCLTPFPAGTFSGEIVVCDRGTIARTAKGQNVLAGGAGGYVLANLGQGEATVADAHFIPAVHIGDSAGVTLRDWLAANTGTMATITPFEFDLSKSNGDVMAGFSSRGPQTRFDVLKPDVTAPGVSVFAAEADGQAASVPEYQFLSGTSMSSPHNAGAGALMTATNPGLTPQEIKSAIMMTSKTNNTLKEDGATPTDPFDLGAGSIRLQNAKNFGLVLSESVINFRAADPSLGGDPSTLNLASMMNSNCVGKCSWTRTVTNKSGATGDWELSVKTNGFDASVKAKISSGKGKVLKSGSKKPTIRLNNGASAEITVKVDNYTAEENWQFGELQLRPKATGKGKKKSKTANLHMPIAVYASKSTNSSLFSKTVSASSASRKDILSYEININNGPVAGPMSVTDVVPKGTVFVAGSETASVTNGSTSIPWAYNSATKSLSWVGELDISDLNVSADGSITEYFSLGDFGIAPFGFPTNCDDGAWTVDIPSFTYNGVSHSSVIFSVNGTLEAGEASGSATSASNQNLPDAAAPNNILAPFWRDLNGCDGGEIYVAVLSNGPYQWTIFEWEDIPHFGSTDAATFQVWLRNDGSPTDVPQAHFTYGRLDNVNDGATVGVENNDGTVGQSFFFDGVGTPPQVNTDLWVNSIEGGSATLGFDVKVKKCRSRILNKASLRSGSIDETAVAATTCE